MKLEGPVNLLSLLQVLVFTLSQLTQYSLTIVSSLPLDYIKTCQVFAVSQALHNPV